MLRSACVCLRCLQEIAHDAWGVVSEFKLTNKPVNPLWEFTSVPEVEVTAKAMLPSTSVISFTLGAGVSFITFVNTVPIDENRLTSSPHHFASHCPT